MVRGIIRFLNKEVRGIHDAAYLLAFFSILSQLLALVRDRLLAHMFGAGTMLDVYYASFRIPDFIFVSIASLVSISVLVPFLVEELQKGKSEAHEFLSSVFTVFFVIIGAVIAVAYFAMPFLLKLFFPTFFESDQGPTMIALSRVILLSPLLLGFSNLLASVTQVSSRFFVYALCPILYNAGIIVGVVVLYPRFGLMGLGFGVALGALLHFVIQIPVVIENGLMPIFKFRIRFNSIKKIVLLSLPRTLTVSSHEISEFFMISLAGILGAGSISIFTFSFNLQSVPLSIIGVSYSLAVFPTLAKLFTSGNKKEFFDKMVVSARHIIFLSLPVTGLFIVLRAQIVRTILGSGHFNWTDTRLTAAALALFVLSLIPQGLVLLFVRAFYSSGSTKKPFLIHLASTVVLIGGSYGFVWLYTHSAFLARMIEIPLKVTDLPGTIVLALPLALTVGVSFNMIVHWIFFEYEFRGFTKAVWTSIAEGLCASLALVLVSYSLLPVLDKVFNINTTLGIFSQGFVAGVAGIGAWVLVLYLLKSKELKEMWQTLHHKIWKAKIVAPDPELG